MTKTSKAFSRRGPDILTEELVSVFLGKKSFEFKTLFLVIHAKLLARKAAGGGEEMLRLRSYEKLQVLVGAGLVAKSGKSYKGNTLPLIAFDAKMKEFHAAMAKHRSDSLAAVPTPIGSV